MLFIFYLWRYQTCRLKSSPNPNVFSHSPKMCGLPQSFFCHPNLSNVPPLPTPANLKVLFCYFGVPGISAYNGIPFSDSTNSSQGLLKRRRWTIWHRFLSESSHICIKLLNFSEIPQVTYLYDIMTGANPKTLVKISCRYTKIWYRWINNLPRKFTY